MKVSQVKNIIRETLTQTLKENKISQDILKWLYSKFDKAEIDKLKNNITPEEITGLNQAYKKAKEGDTGFAIKYVKNIISSTIEENEQPPEDEIKSILDKNNIESLYYKIGTYGGNAFHNKKYFIWRGGKLLPDDLFFKLNHLIRLNNSEPHRPHYDIIKK